MKYIRRCTNRASRLVALCLLFSIPCPAAAFADDASVHVVMLPADRDDDNMMQTWLGAALKHYAHGMDRWLSDALKGAGGTVSNEDELLLFQWSLRHATVAYFQYTYDARVDGEDEKDTQVYVGVSGPTLSHLVNRHFPGRGTLQTAGFHESDYLGEGEAIVHATGPSTSAEAKVVDTIRRDIASGKVRTGGTLLGFVSRKPCFSCAGALKAFAEDSHVSVHVNYVDADSSHPTYETPLFNAFRDLRDTLVDEMTSKFAARKSRKRPSAEVNDIRTASTSLCDP